MGVGLRPAAKAPEPSGAHEAVAGGPEHRIFQAAELFR